MKSKSPYLLRALYDWIVDSELTPYLVVAVDSEQVHVPREFVDEGKIVLNVSPMAVRNLVLGNEVVTFDGRFSGRSFSVSTPVANVLTIYAKETGEGMMFDQDSHERKEDKSEAGEGEPTRSQGKKSSEHPRQTDHLKIVK